MYKHCKFSGWGQFLQKLCKNCPHPENSFSNSKTIGQIKFPYRIEKIIKSQQEWPGGKTLCRSLVTCKGFFCPVVLLLILLLCENDKLRKGEYLFAIHQNVPFFSQLRADKKAKFCCYSNKCLALLILSAL